MNDDQPPQWSRRTALRALTVGSLAAAAGCQFGTNDDGSGNGTNTTRSAPTGTQSERTDADGTTAVQEQTIISGSPAATAGRRAATTDGRPSSTTGSATTAPRTASSTSSAPRTETSSTATGTPTATATESATGTETATTAETATATETATAEPTATETATSAPEPPDGSSGEWRERAPLPVVGSDAGGGVLDGKLHFFGGIETAVELDATAHAFVYDPSAGSEGAWERLPDLPRALWGLCGVATDDAVYSFGGAPDNSPYSSGSPSDAIFRYRPDEGWTDLTESAGVRCPYPNWVMGGLYNPQDGLIYCVGGGTGDHDADTASNHGLDGEGTPGTYDERRLWTFDPEAERVADPDLARMPEAKRWPTVALFEVDGSQYLHAIGGLRGTTGPTDSNFRYDIAAGEWESATPTPMAGTYATHSNPVIDGRAYLTHGMFWQGESTIDRYKPIAHRYDPASDTFETDLPEPTHLRGGAVSGVIDGTLYVVGGHLKRFGEDDLHDCVAYNEAYTPARE